MKIRTRIAIQFSLIVSVILILFSLFVYAFSSKHRQEEFCNRLQSKALTTVKLLADVDEVDSALLKIIDKNSTHNLINESLVIYNSKGRLVYNSPNSEEIVIPNTIFERTKSETKIEFRDVEKDGIGIFFKGKYDDYIVVAKAFDIFGLSKLNNLRLVLTLGVSITILFTLFIGLFFAKQALNPLSKMVNKVDEISISNMGLRLDEGNQQDEIALLSIKFNKMLERLSAAFDLQRSFVANASHELRTPLTALTGQIEVALMNPAIETNNILQSLLTEIKKLNKLSNGLLDLAQANLDISEIRMEVLRIDEIITSASYDVIKKNKEFKPEVIFDFFPDDENWLKLRANEHLLKSAFQNLIDNACKYSANKKCEIKLYFTNKNITIKIIDEGIGISESELPRIFEPFFRSINVKSYPGHGIGLTLAKKIFEIHGTKIEINSKLHSGTVVAVTLPHI